MATPSKTIGTSVITHQAVTHPGTVVGSAQSVTTAIQVTVFLDQGFVEVAVNTDPASWLIQVSAQSSGNEEWYTIQEILLTEDGTPATEALSGSESDNTLAVASTTGFSEHKDIYVEDTGVLASSEWAFVHDIVTDTSINILDNLTNAKDSSDVIWGQAERNIVTVNVESIARYRVVYIHEGAAGANTHIRATATVEDSFG